MVMIILIIHDRSKSAHNLGHCRKIKQQAENS